jgi:hypothetical protein
MVNIQSTRGGLKPGTITNLKKTSQVVKFMFNPSEFTLDKTNDWKHENQIGKDYPKLTFKYGKAQTLGLKLYFDTLETGVDVRRYTENLWEMMKVHPGSNPPSPPAVAFEWGVVYFKAIIQNISQKFSAFDAEGTPVRCEITVKLEQYVEDDETPKAIEYGGTNPASVVKIEGMPLEVLAAGLAGAVTAQTIAEATRAVAAANGIDNPLSVQNGTTINS